MTKVVVAMSGGVDSSVAATLLKEQGHEVVGMMLRLWSEPGKENSNRCCTPDAMAQARRVAAQLDIPFYAIDAREIFFTNIVQYFLQGYEQGITPNPCLVCNRIIRWKFLLEHALAIGADYLATGHYARLQTRSIPTSEMKNVEIVQLMKATDRSKDQSYVLHQLDQEQLKRAMFPLGEYAKVDVRKLAAKYGLPSAARPDSQDLCFLAGEDYRDFIIRHVPQVGKPGDIVNSRGDLLGKHRGLYLYTIGQRKSLGFSSPEPLYVLAKRINENVLVVGPQEELGCSELMVKEVSWISGEPLIDVTRAQVKVRYTAREAWAELQPLENGQVLVKFDEPQRDITAGQAAVFYDGEFVLGGGTIATD